MIRSFKFALRHQKSHKLFTGINVIGMAMSLLASYLLVTYLVQEFTYDTMYTNYDRIHRLNVIYKRPDSQNYWPCAPPALAPLLPSSHPAIAKVARLYQADFSHRFQHGDKGYIETRIFYADSLFLEILDYPLLVGDRTTALDNPNSILLTRRTAEKYFGDTDIIGRLLVLNTNRTLTVTGVLEDIPATSHLNFDFLASFSTFEIPLGYTDDLTSWRWNSFITYVTLEQPASKENVENAIRNTWLSNTQLVEGRDIGIELQPVRQIYLNSGAYDHPYLSKHFRKGNVNALYGLIGAVVILLLIAVFNFTNISMASFIKRSKAVSISKILGSRMSDMMKQFLSEAVIVITMALLIGLAVLVAFSEQFSELTGYPVLEGVPFAGRIAGILSLVILAIVLLSLIYPMMVIRRLDVLRVLKEGIVIRQSKISVQHILIIFQVCITASLLSSTFIVKKQLNFLAAKDLGINKENVLVVQMLGEDMAEHYDKIKDAMEQRSNILSVSRCKYSFDGKSGGSPLKLADAPDSEFKSVAVYEAHYDFLETTGIRLVEGRDFSPLYPTDSVEAIILNQAAVEELGLTGQVVGTEVTLLDWRKRIVGVVEDFNYSSLHSGVGPLVIVMPFTNSTKIYLKLAPGDVRESVASIHDQWLKIVPEIPFDYLFLDQLLDQLYRNDQRFSKLIDLFAAMAIATACLGLIGISWFGMNLRLKEVAIRKVLGAGMLRIVTLLTRQFVVQLTIALAISIPISMYITRNWLSGFAYRIDTSADAMLFSALAIAIIMCLLLAYLSAKIAFINPVKNLRSE